MLCLACQATNEAGAATCYRCGKPLPTGLQPGRVVASRYEVLSTLGSGGMGTVYKAHDRVLDERVALKVLRPEIAQDAEMARRFLSEVKLARKVTHKNVCRIHEYGEEGRLLYLSMEFVAGTNLKKVIEAQEGLLADGAYEVAIEIALGLQAIHDVGIIHRDLKTANIMLDSRSIVRLMDFGIAKEWGASGGNTATGVIVGTPEYMSPEQARGEKLDFGSDVYALGIVIFELFTGRVPFHGETAMGTLYKHVHEPPPLDAAIAEPIPPPLRRVLRKALAKKRDDRHATVRELADALRQAQSRLYSGGDRAPAPAQAPAVAAAPMAVETAPTGPISIGDSNRLLLALEEVTASLRHPPAVERLLNTLVTQAKQLTGAAAGRVLLFEGTPRGDQAVDASAGDAAEELRGARVKAGGGIAVLVSEGEALLLRDASAHARYAPPCDQMPASPGFLGVPLRHGAIRGALLVAGRETHGFETQDKDLLLRLAQHSSVALDNAVSASRSLDAFTHTSEILLSFLERTDARYPDHSRSVAAFADGVATSLGLGEEELLPIHFAALLHDIGKVRVNPALLNATGELSDAERQLVQEHVILGVQLLAPISPFREIPDIIHAHHERWDGRGYPRGLAGEQIPIGARIVAVADAFDAMTRPGSGLTPEEAMAAIEGQAGSQFDPSVARAFVLGQRERLARLAR